MHDDLRESPSPVSALPEQVVENILAELGPRGDRAVAYVRTAAALLGQIDAADPKLRLPETVAYNIREALDSIVAGRDAAEGGLASVGAAWNQFSNAQQLSPSAIDAATIALHEAVATAVSNSDRNSYRTRQLFEYLRTKTGVAPLEGDTDPLGRYTKLRERGNNALHGDTTVDDVVALYADCLSWLTRMFTPPDALAEQIVQLARQTYAGPDQVHRARELCHNAHQLTLLLAHVVDPAWLDPLHDAGIIGLPTPGEVWPFHGLIDGLGATVPQPVADQLLSLVEDTKQLAKTDRPNTAFEIMRAAARLGEAGHAPAWKVIDAYSAGDRWIQGLAVQIVRQADPAARIVVRVADAVLNADSRYDGSHHAGTVLAALTAGLNVENAQERIRLVAVKLRNLANSDSMRYSILDAPSLSADLEQHDDMWRITAHYLVRLTRQARILGLGTSALLDWTSSVPSELGSRLTCQVLAGASDVSTADKISHAAGRLTSATVTGDDRDLLADILTDGTALPGAVAAWTVALGHPSTPDDPETDGPPPEDWVRVWGWSVILPPQCLAAWSAQIASIIQRHGEPNLAELDRRVNRSSWMSEDSSPIPTDALAGMSPTVAAAAVASWGADTDDSEVATAKRDLARGFERAAAQNLEQWAAEADQIVAVLGDPIYVGPFLRALVVGKLDVTAAAVPILAAVRSIVAEWTATTTLGDTGPDRDRNVVASLTLDLISSLAGANADLSHEFDALWAFTTAMTLTHPEGHTLSDPLREDNALNSAVNQLWGKAFYAVLALAAWQYRNNSQPRSDLPGLLDTVVAIQGAVGIELRAIIAQQRRLLEAVAPDWLEANAATLFDDQSTFDLTLRSAPPTTRFLDQFQDRLIAAAKHGSSRAVHYLLIGVFWQTTGYTIQEILDAIWSSEEAIGNLCAEMASLVQNEESDSAALEQATGFWRAVLDDDRTTQSSGALVKLGRWAFVDNVAPDDHADLMTRTVQATGGAIDYEIEVADRWRTLGKPHQHLPILLAMLGHGDPWERDYVERTAVACLRAAAPTAQEEGATDSFNALRSRLIDRGKYDAKDIALREP